jgi:hypothetical protein
VQDQAELRLVARLDLPGVNVIITIFDDFCQFAATFADFRRYLPIFDDFCRFSANKLALLLKTNIMIPTILYKLVVL